MGNYITNTIRALFRDKTGNISIMSAISLTAIIGIAGLAIETTRLQSLRGDLRDIADVSALAGAAIATTQRNKREDVVKDVVSRHVAMLGSMVTLQDPEIKFDDKAQTVTVVLTSTQTGFLSGMIGKKNNTVVGRSVSSYAIDNITPVSMAFVLDISGSMSWRSSDGKPRIKSLKKATNLLLNKLEEGSSNPNLLRQHIRTGMTAYNSQIVKKHTVSLDYGWDHLEKEVNRLRAGGGTNSADAFSAAIDLLENDTKKPTGDYRKFIIFMTDGANNYSGDSSTTVALCERAMDLDIEVFSVAFGAPLEGENMLLECASYNKGDAEASAGSAKPTENAKSKSAENNKYQKKKRRGKKKHLLCQFKDLRNVSKKLKGKCEAAKSEYFFKAENSKAFEDAFEKIGEEIAKSQTRIVG